MSKEINNKYGSQTKENPREFTKEFTFDDRYVMCITLRLMIRTIFVPTMP